MSSTNLSGLAGLIRSADPESPEEARQRVIERVMKEHQVVSSAWSMIDGPFAQQHAIDDHQMALDEFRALVGRVVHLPLSVEGIRYLEQWFERRVHQLGELKAAANVGTEIEWCAVGESSPLSLVLTEDMAMGIRMVLEVVENLFGSFPLTLTTTREADEDLSP